MALPSLLTENAFLLFRHHLKRPEAECLGYFELLCIRAQLNMSPNLGNAPTLEALAGWTGKPGHLASALLESGLCERTRGHRIDIADFWTKRACDWAKKRAERAAPNGADRRRAAKNGADRRPTDPIPDPPTDPESDQPPNRSKASPDRRSVASTPSQGGPNRPANRPGQPESAGDTLARLLAGQNPAQRSRLAPGQRLDYGPLGARDLARVAAHYETTADPQVAEKLWLKRARELELVAGGLDFFRQQLLYLDRAIYRGNPDGVPTPQHPARILNSSTAQYLRTYRKAVP